MEEGGGRREGWRGWRMEGGHENEEEHKEEEEERKGGGKGKEERDGSRVKHCELSSMYTPLTLLTQYTACLSLCCLSISGTSHWRPRWPQRKC